MEEAYDYTTVHVLHHGTVNNHRRHLLRLQSILIQSGERESEMVRLKEKRTAQKRRIFHILQGTFCRQFSAFQSPPSGDSLESLNRHFPPCSVHNIRKKEQWVKGEPQHVSGTAESTIDQIKVGINKSFIGHKSRGAPVIFLTSVSALMRLLTFSIGEWIWLFRTTTDSFTDMCFGVIPQTCTTVRKIVWGW